MDVNIGREINLQSQPPPAQRRVQTERPGQDQVQSPAPSVSQNGNQTESLNSYSGAAPEIAGRTQGLDMGSSSEILQPIIEYANARLEPISRSLRVSIHEATNRFNVKVIDTKTNEVIREVPPERLLDLIANVKELAGIIVDERQ